MGDNLENVSKDAKIAALEVAILLALPASHEPDLHLDYYTLLYFILRCVLYLHFGLVLLSCFVRCPRFPFLPSFSSDYKIRTERDNKAPGRGGQSQRRARGECRGRRARQGHSFTPVAM